jgi:predicted ATP-grasp superfamily ATP-dependent carboligase
MVPDALREPERFAHAILALVATERAALVVPITEPAVLALLPMRDRLAPAVLPFPDADAFNELSDKQRVLAEASRLGIAVPRQTVLANLEEMTELDLHALRFPIVIKPARSVGEHAGVRQKVAVAYARDADELARRIRALPAAAFPLLLQQRVSGPGIGVFFFLWNGEQRAHFAHRRLCEKPPSGGVSVYRESVMVEPALRDLSRALLKQFRWQGVAMVEFKQDAETGESYLMEINGRFWGSLQLAIDAGVDFPRMLAASALGDGMPMLQSYQVGVRSRWWWGQVDHILARVRRRKESVPLARGTITLAQACFDLLCGPFRRDDREEVFRWDDPMPFVSETRRWISDR